MQQSIKPFLPSIKPKFTFFPKLNDKDCKTECNSRPAEFINNQVECWGDFYWSCAKNESQYFASFVAAKCNGHFLWLPGVPSPDSAVAVCEGLQHYFFKDISYWSVVNMTFTAFGGNGCLGTFSSVIESEESGSTTGPPLALPPSFPDFSELESLLDEEYKSSRNLSGVEGMKSETRCDGKGGEIFVISHKVEKWMTSASELSISQVSSLTPTEAVKLLQSEVEEEAKVSGLTAPDDEHQSFEVGSESSSTISFHVDQSEFMGCEITCNGSPAWFHGLFPCWGKLEVTCKSDSAWSEVGSCRGLWTGFVGKMCMGLTLDHSQGTWKGHPDNKTTYSVDNFRMCSGKHGLMLQHGIKGKFAMGSSCHGKGIHRHIDAKTTEASNRIERTETA